MILLHNMRHVIMII